MAQIDIGDAAIGRADRTTPDWCYVTDGNPANDTGTLIIIEVWMVGDSTNVEVGTLWESDTDKFTSRDSEVLGNVTGGSKQTYSGLDCDVNSGDYIGGYCQDAFDGFEMDAGTNICWRWNGNPFGAGEKSYSKISDQIISIYGLGPITLSLTDGVSCADSIVKNFTKNLTEGGVLADVIAKTITKPLADGAVCADAIAKTVTKVLSEGVVLADVFSRICSFFRTFAEGIVCSDAIAKTLSRPFTDGVKIADSIGKNVFIGLSDGVKVTVSSLVATMRWKSIGNTWSGAVKWVRNLLTWVGWSKTPESSITWTKKTKNTQTWTKKGKREC